MAEDMGYWRQSGRCTDASVDPPFFFLRKLRVGCILYLRRLLLLRNCNQNAFKNNRHRRVALPYESWWCGS